MTSLMCSFTYYVKLYLFSPTLCILTKHQIPATQRTPVHTAVRIRVLGLGDTN